MEHTFVICAYQNSPYVEDCVKSLKKQTVPSEIVLATSTPSRQLEELCSKYHIPYCVREGRSGIAPDWNYALQCAKTPYVTIAHQDDLYYPDYTEQLLQKMKKNKDTLIAFSDYRELRDMTERSGLNLKIKQFLLMPLRISALSDRTFLKRWVLRFGNAICCPAVTYHRGNIAACLRSQGRSELFESHFRSNLDWETWQWLSGCEGRFCYIAKPLMAHRIHSGSETSATIKDHQRVQEDYEMFCRFWPKWLARLLVGCYKNSEKSNEL